MEQKYSIFKQLLCGSIAGWASVTTGQPFDLLKVRFQLGQDASLKWIQSYIKQNGIFSMYRGASSVYLFTGAITALQFSVFEAIKKLGRHLPYLNLGQNSWQQHILSGSAVGLLSSFIFTPVEYTKISTQMDQSSQKIEGSASRMLSILRSKGLHGVRRLYTGHTWTLIRQIPGAGIYFGGFYILLQNFAGKGRDSATLFNQLAASGLAAFIYVLYAYPFDVVKTNIQSGNKSFRQLINCRFWKEKMFLSGLRIAIVRGVIIDMTLLPVYQNCRRYLYSQNQNF